MADELDARLRALLAERYRPEVTRAPADPLRDLIAVLHRLFTVPPDSPPEPGRLRERDSQ
ncbi:hypothetical protein [Actinomadura litoris]|uniref:hypothetical protein n=1 Tax=Actinomadura litoris TaxID=2678616 RepID=UPI001FA74727|nr:hypothetical protein [Actinomadura litoris]